jgi:hypothetical protein
MRFKQLQIASFGVRILRRLREGFGLSAGCRWRPCQQGAELLASLCSRRRLQLEPAALLSLLDLGKLPMRELRDLDAAGRLEGWGTVERENPPTSARRDPEFGGVVVGLHSAAVHPRRLWVAAMLNEQGLVAFAGRAELASAAAALRLFASAA